jgi:hypothetical protein
MNGWMLSQPTGGRLLSLNLSGGTRQYHRNIFQNSQRHDKDLNQDNSGKSADGYRYINLLDVEIPVNMYLSRRRQAPEHQPNLEVRYDYVYFACGLETVDSDMDHSYIDSIKKGW